MKSTTAAARYTPKIILWFNGRSGNTNTLAAASTSNGI